MNVLETRAAVDVGSNTILLCTARRYATTPIHWNYCSHLRFARLAEGLEQRGVISEAALRRAEKILREYRTLFQQLCRSARPFSPLPGRRPVCLKAVATEALRVAENRNVALARLEAALNAPIEVISAKREAQLTYLGAVERKASNASQHTVVLDIGGGSTELGFGRGSRFQQCLSLPVGAIRYREKYPITFPFSAGLRRRLEEDTYYHLQRVLPEPERTSWCAVPFTLIGVAGVPTSLAALKYKTPGDHFDQLHLKTLSLAEVEQFATQLTSLSLAELLALAPVIDKDRCYLIGVSALLLRVVMRYLRAKAITVSVRGLRYGLLQEPRHSL